MYEYTKKGYKEVYTVLIHDCPQFWWGSKRNVYSESIFYYYHYYLRVSSLKTTSTIYVSIKEYV